MKNLYREQEINEKHGKALKLSAIKKPLLIKSDTYKGISVENMPAKGIPYVNIKAKIKQAAKLKKLQLKVKKRANYKCFMCDKYNRKNKVFFKHNKLTLRDAVVLCSDCYDWVELNKPKRIRRIKI